MGSTREQRRSRRQLGVNFRNCLKKYREIKADGGVDMDDPEAVADAIMTELIAAKFNDPAIDWGTIDWEKVLAFILSLIRIFMSFV